MRETTGKPAASSPTSDGHSRGLSDYLRRPLELFRNYRRPDLAPDLVAGLTVAAVAIPQAVAYASIAELPPQMGLYAAMVASIVGALWGSSRFLSTGPVNAVSLVALPILLGVAAPGTPLYLIAAGTLAFMTGIIEVSLSIMRFGALVTLASRSVLLGFAAGAAVHIAVGQVRHLLRLHIATSPELSRTVLDIASAASGTHLISLILGLGTLAILMALRRIGPRMPAALAAITASGVLVYALGLESQGVHVVGAIPRSLPPLTWGSLESLPDFHTISALVTGSLALAALGLVEAVASAQAVARKSKDRIDSNQEFFGQGLANIASGMLSGFPCSGSFVRTTLSHQTGARTRMTGLFTGLGVLAGMLILAPLARYLPRAAIAGVLLFIAWSMIDWSGIRRVIRTSRAEAAIMAATFAATLAFPLDFAVLAGVMFSLAFFVIRSSLPRVYQVVPDPTFRHLVRKPGAPVCPQLGIMNIRGPLFFGALYHVEEELRHNHEENPGQNILLLRMHGVDLCDISGIEMLESTVKSHRDMGGDVYLVRLRQPVQEVLDRYGFLGDTLGLDHVLPQEGAIEYLFEEVLDPVVCTYECEYRVFAECRSLEKHPYEASVPPFERQHVHEVKYLDVAGFQDFVGRETPLIIDVREPGEYGRGHVAGARLIPLRSLPDEAPSLPRDRPIVIQCRSGRRTARAMIMLHALGFERVYGLRGGMLAWRAAGLPVRVED